MKIKHRYGDKWLPQFRYWLNQRESKALPEEGAHDIEHVGCQTLAFGIATEHDA